ncbi:hypothetical protein PQC07_gp087 [Aeromonas phage D3]|uniref:Uncharacterized protein n=1 Tax=Aeromonas phage D3 TaxID=2593327 RepID=A0A514TV65_9CAUD|nr:hypothetical protein PQC07_gp087 [Aeromonas phage D3]QDJ96918.1 hypothetical protein D3_0188 [Aeromonas phage D3]
MITDKIERSKIIKDPVFSAIKAYVTKRLNEIHLEGDQKKIDLARQRYLGIAPDNVQIEPVKTFANGIMRACFLTRAGAPYFHADALIEKQTLLDIFRDFEIAPTKIKESDLIVKIEDKVISFGIFYLTDKKEYAIVLNSGKKSIKDVQGLLGDLYWDKLTVSIDNAINASTRRSGSVTPLCVAMQNYVIPVFYAEHVIAAKMKK